MDTKTYVDNLIRAKEKMAELLELNKSNAVIQFLNSLKYKPITRDILKQTGMGKYLERVKKTCKNRNITDLCDDVITIWKAELKKEKKKIQEGGDQVNRNYRTFADAEKKNPKKLDIEDMPAVPQVKRVQDEDGNIQYVEVNVKPVDLSAKRSREQVFRTHAPKQIKKKERYPEENNLRFTYSDRYRNHVCNLLYSSMIRDSNLDPRTVFNLIQKIEEEVWKRYGETKNKEYISRLRSINYCLRDEDNPEFNQKIISKVYKPDYIADMPVNKMISFERQEGLELMKSEFWKINEGAKEPLPETDMFKCGKCKKRKCRYYQKQIRSADEPMTTFVTCVNCSHSWKFC